MAAGTEGRSKLGYSSFATSLHRSIEKDRLGEVKPQFPTEQSESGEFQRQEDAFREWISNDGSTSYPAVADRYHLYVSLACPWASRTVIFRKLKGLEEVMGMTIVDPIRDEKGWAFRPPSAKWPPDNSFDSTDSLNGF